MDQKLVEAVAKTAYIGRKDQPSRRKNNPHRLRCEGRYITTHSGKTVWGSKGAAANALNLELSYSAGGALRHRRVTQDLYEVTCDEINFKQQMTYAEYRNLLQAVKEQLKSRVEVVPASEDFY